jgi:hypothetical protein
MLKWLRYQVPPCPIKLNHCIALAAEKGHIEVVDWLRIQSGCAKCSRDNCRCKNREIKLPVNYKHERNKILLERKRAIERNKNVKDKFDTWYF